MSPTPLIELQRRLAEAGRIRMGEKTDEGAPKRLTTWRITSPTKELIEQAAERYGGLVAEWTSPTGQQWEVVTASSELSVLLMPAYSLRQTYEFRTSPTLVERRCDGIEMDGGTPCVCNVDGLVGKAACDLITRLTVALPELTTLLGWRLESKGDAAAKELLTSMELVQGVGGGRPFIPAKLRIVERRGNVDGQAVRFVVPVLDIAVAYGSLFGAEQSQDRAELPAGYTPIPERTVNGVSLADGLREAETQTLRKPPRVRLAEDDGLLDEEPGAPSFPAEPGGSVTDAAPQASTGQKPTKRMLTKLDVIVGTLRDTLGAITTEQLYSALAKSRNIDVTLMIDVTDGAYGTDGVLHWAPLRDSLTRVEASDLIERLQRLEENVPKAAA